MFILHICSISIMPHDSFILSLRIVVYSETVSVSLCANYSSMSVVLHCIIFFTFVYSKVWKTVWTPSKSFTTPFIVFLNHFQLFPSNFWAPLILFPALNPALLSVMPRQKTIKINPYNTALGATFAHVWSYQTVHICLLHDSIQGKKAILVLQPIMGHRDV